MSVAAANRRAAGVCTLTLPTLATDAYGRAGPQRVPDTGLAGNYRAVLELPAGELPFGLEFLPDGPAAVGYLVNGKERVWLSGEVVLSKPGGKQQHIPFHAQRGQVYRFFQASANGEYTTLIADCSRSPEMHGVFRCLLSM